MCPGLRSPLLIEINDDAHNIVERQERVGHDKHPIVRAYTIHNKSERGGELAHEKPFGNAVIRSFLPLFMDLFDKGDQQDYRTCPAYGLYHHLRRQR